MRVAAAYQRREPPVTRPEVEKSPDGLGQRFEQHQLGCLAVGDLAGQILVHTAWIRPLLKHPRNDSRVDSPEQAPLNCGQAPLKSAECASRLGAPGVGLPAPTSSSASS